MEYKKFDYVYIEIDKYNYDLICIKKKKNIIF